MCKTSLENIEITGGTSGEIVEEKTEEAPEKAEVDE